jgi:hypothetical protein
MPMRTVLSVRRVSTSASVSPVSGFAWSVASVSETETVAMSGALAVADFPDKALATGSGVVMALVFLH